VGLVYRNSLPIISDNKRSKLAPLIPCNLKISFYRWIILKQTYHSSSASSSTLAIMKVEPPPNWLETIENIRKIRQKYPAPVDSMGCDQAHYDRESETTKRFLVLVSLLLSSQTKDPITWAAVRKLKDKGLDNPKEILTTKEKDIEDLIHPVGFFRRKAVYLKKVSQILLDEHNGDIPDTVEGLCKLPGVGPKMAHLCMQEAWNVVSGIGVDTHVHRIAARLGWVPAKGIKTPEDTRKALELWLPREHWREINHMLVGLGQTICTPLRPKCGECLNNHLCPSSTVGKTKVKSPSKSRKTASNSKPEPSSPPVSTEPKLRKRAKRGAERDKKLSS